MAIALDCNSFARSRAIRSFDCGASPMHRALKSAAYLRHPRDSCGRLLICAGNTARMGRVSTKITWQACFGKRAEKPSAIEDRLPVRSLESGPIGVPRTCSRASGSIATSLPGTILPGHPTMQMLVPLTRYVPSKQNGHARFSF